MVKFVGAAYLVYLGWGALRAKGGFSLPQEGASRIALRRIFWQGFLSDVLNPKVALFYISLLPQFISAHDQHPLQHLLTLGVIGNMVGISTSVVYVFLASRMTQALRRNQTISAWLAKAVGALFVGLGLKLTTEKL